MSIGDARTGAADTCARCCTKHRPHIFQRCRDSDYDGTRMVADEVRREFANALPEPGILASGDLLASAQLTRIPSDDFLAASGAYGHEVSAPVESGRRKWRKNVDAGRLKWTAQQHVSTRDG